MTEQNSRRPPGGGVPPSSAMHADSGLKIVTISPRSLSQPDVEPEVLPGTVPPPVAAEDAYIGCTIDGRYKVEARLGEGGMGVVYRCTHKIIGKKVAMKVLRADLARDVEVTERFLNEAKSASAIGNPHIIDISDFGQLPDGSTYFVMEFLNGVPLSSALEGGRPLPVQRILHIARQLAEGLSAAHKSEIVHRDLKPDNIFLVPRGSEKDFVKILDFGIAKVSHGEGKLTRVGAVFGTPHYMSPEQAAGAPVDHRGDVYSFGVILYELASGRVPFDADNFMGILTQHMYKAPVPIRAIVPQPQEVPPGLEAIILKCLSKRPEQRYASMDDLIVELDKIRDGGVPDAVPEMMARSGGFNVPANYFKRGHGMPEPVPATPIEPRFRSRWPLYAGLAGVLAAVGLVVAIFAKSAQSSATSSGLVDRPAVVEPTAPVEAELGAPSDEPTATPVPDDAVIVKQVVIAVDPLDARAFAGEHDLGQSPVVVEVPEGETMEVEIRRNGYRSETLSLDGSVARRSITLKRIPSGGRPAAPAPVAKQPRPEPKKAAPPAKKSSIGGGEIVNPWE